jgi:hypothetical protein
MYIHICMWVYIYIHRFVYVCLTCSETVKRLLLLCADAIQFADDKSDGGEPVLSGNE